MNEKYVDQTLNIGSIRRFLSRQESIFLFLALVGALTVLLVVFGQPTSLTEFVEQRSPLSPLGQISICFVSGYAVLIVSRIALFFFSRNREIQPAAIIMWLLLEMIVCVTVVALVLWAVSGAGKVQLALLVGDLVLGFLGLQIVPYVITYLIYRLYEARQELARLHQALDRMGSTPQQQADTTINFYAKGGRLAFSTKLSNLLYIEAADNYVNIHYLNNGKEDTFILHNSLKELEKRFTSGRLVRCHRGYMVNVGNVKLMRKENIGLVLELDQTAKAIPVSKSYAESIIQYFASNTEIPLPDDEK